jgi:hypothetical protein
VTRSRPVSQRDARRRAGCFPVSIATPIFSKGTFLWGGLDRAFPCVFPTFLAHLDTSKVERAAFSLSGEACVSETWDLGNVAYKLQKPGTSSFSSSLATRGRLLGCLLVASGDGLLIAFSPKRFPKRLDMAWCTPRNSAEERSSGLRALNAATRSGSAARIGTRFNRPGTTRAASRAA